MKFNGSLRPVAMGLAALAIGNAPALAQFDATIDALTVTQSIQTGTTPLTAFKSTIVRTEVNLVNPPTATVDLDGIMRVFVNGVEAPFSPVYSVNGPYPAKMPADLSKQKGTLNFLFRPPASGNVVCEVEINPAGPNFVPETNTTNNKLSTASLAFLERNIAEFAYSPIDYRPSGGGTPNVPNPTLIEPGSGDGFIQGIYPGADVNYHRTDAASKLWTSSLSGTGSGLLSSLNVDRASMSPVPEFLYGWVPGGLPYNGQAFLNSGVAMGNTQSFKFQRTYAHEVGHNVGLSHTSWTIQEFGYDVEHHLNVTEGLPVIKATSLRNIMDAGLNTNQAWVRSTHYEWFYNHNKFKNLSFPDAGGTPSLMVNGTWNVKTGEIELHHVVEVPGGQPTIPVADSQRQFTVRAFRAGKLSDEVAIMAATQLDTCSDSEAPLTEVGVTVSLPLDGVPIDRFELLPKQGVDAAPITLVRSSFAPEIQFVTPAADGDVSGNGKVLVNWNALDRDGDPMLYYLRYSNDGVNFAPLATGITETEYEVDLRQLARLVDGKGFFELRASDGLNTTVARTSTLKGSGTFFAQAGNNPWVFISTPDNGKAYWFGATVILHSGSWDLEDNALIDPLISWSSSIDGALGTGRIMSKADLSVGFHTITVTATDSDAMTATDTTDIEIKARNLPGLPAVPIVYCTPGTSASGCTALISGTGTPSATAATGFVLDITGLEGQKDGLFFFGANGRQANAWGSGTSFQCVAPPVKRAGLQLGNGTIGLCDATFSQDLNARWTAKPAQNPGAGAVVQAQAWYRDPQNTSNQTTSLSNALEFVVEP